MTFNIITWRKYCFVILCWSGVLVPNEDGLPLRHLHSLLVSELLHRLVMVVVDYCAAGEHLLRGGWAQRCTVCCCRPENTADRSSARAHERQTAHHTGQATVFSLYQLPANQTELDMGIVTKNFELCVYGKVFIEVHFYHGIKKVIVFIS